MSTLSGLSGPRVPTSTPSAAREAPRTSFLSRVQTSSSASVPLQPANPPVVSGRDIISKALSAQKDAKSGSTQGSESNGETEQVKKQKEAIMEMSRSFVMGTVQSIFAGVGQSGSSLPKQEDWG